MIWPGKARNLFAELDFLVRTASDEDLALRRQKGHLLIRGRVGKPGLRPCRSAKKYEQPRTRGGCCNPIHDEMPPIFTTARRRYFWSPHFSSCACACGKLTKQHRAGQHYSWRLSTMSLSRPSPSLPRPSGDSTIMQANSCKAAVRCPF